MIKLNTFGPLKNEFKVEGAKSFAEVKNIIDSKSGARPYRRTACAPLRRCSSLSWSRPRSPDRRRR